VVIKKPGGLYQAAFDAAAKKPPPTGWWLYGPPASMGLTGRQLCHQCQSKVFHVEDKLPFTRDGMHTHPAPWAALYNYSIRETVVNSSFRPTAKKT
jgi:hypothetical protein